MKCAKGQGSENLRPVIGVPADVCNVDEPLLRHSVDDNIVRAISQVARGLPVVIPAMPDAIDLDAILDRVDGMVFPGAWSNVYPGHYGVAPSVDHEPYDHRRDGITLALIRRVLERGIPLLCICRGYQELNVALGGSLDTDIHRMPGRLNHSRHLTDAVVEWFEPAHSVTLDPGGVLAQLLGKSEMMVNSLHRQAISKLGRGIFVEAVAPDGTVEAISVRSACGFAIGTQWHPEHNASANPDSVRLFRAFGDAAREYVRVQVEKEQRAEA